MLRIFDTLSGELKALPKSPDGETRMFVCGPTVYDYSHIGHARTYLMFDAFAKYVASRGNQITYLQNITDVDDRIIARAREEKKSPSAVASFYTDAYLEDMGRLGITSVRRHARASKFIPAIVKQVRELMGTGHAYTIPNDGIYFDITTFPGYGKLSRRTAAQAEDGVSRIDESIAKHNRGDFALWKFPEHELTDAPWWKRTFVKNGEPFWKTQLGWGRPGWHIEDTAITESSFGTHYEIHGGAADLKFPHHEAEIAQQESLSGQPLVDVWMHTGFLTIGGAKMSKSKGNFTTIRDFLKNHEPGTLRWMTLTNHYRSPVDYSPTLIEQTEAQIERFRSFFGRLTFVRTTRSNTSRPNPSVPREIRELNEKFHGALEDDFNTPTAFAHLFTFMSSYQDRVFGLSKGDAASIQNSIAGLLKTLGISITTRAVPREVQKIAEERELYRVRKQFVHADGLRKELERLGYKVSDTPYGPLTEKCQN